MPIHEFICDSCGERKEVIVLKKSDEPKECKCGGKYDKVISAPNFKVEGFNAENHYSNVKDKKGKSDGDNGKVS
ncbi:MAG: zinc ribbon domain-containing protein [Desulfobacteraceae bacterium]|jgi:putative FmdB family regulatory protein